MSNVVTLEAVFNAKGWTEGGKAIKDVGTASQDTGKKIDDLTGKLDKTNKTTTSLSQKIKGFGSTFQSSIGSLSTFGGTVLNLSRQYQDLSDSQIRVDRTQLKVSKTAEAVRAAQDKVNGLLKKGVSSGAEYEKAILDVKQAQEASTLAVTMNGEALEDQQRAQENFWIGLVPTVTSAGGSIMSVLNDIGGTKGLGGLTSKFKTFGTSIKGVGSSIATALSGTSGATKGIESLTSKITELGNTGKAGGGGVLNNLIGSKTKMAGLLGIAAAAGVAYIGINKIFDLMEQKKNIQIGQALINPKTGLSAVGNLEKQIDVVKKNRDDLATKFWDFMKAGPIGQTFLGPTTEKVANEVIKSLESAIERQKQIDILTPLMKKITSTPMPASAKTQSLNLIQKIIEIYKNPENFKNADFTSTTEGILKQYFGALDGQLRRGTWTEGLSGTMVGEFNKVWQKVETSIKLKDTAPITRLFALDPKPISESNDILGKYAATIKNFGSTVANAGTQVATAVTPLKTMGELLAGLTGKMRESFLGANKGAEFTGLTKMFAIDPKPISASADAIGKLAQNVKNFGTASNYFATVQKQNAQASELAAKGAQDHAAASLQLKQVFDTMGTPISQVNQVMASMTTTEKDWITNTKAAIDSETVHKQSLVAFLQANGANNASLKMTIDTLEAAVQNLFRGAKGYDALTKAIQQTTKATLKYNYAAGVPVPKGKTVSGPTYTYHGQKYYGTPPTSTSGGGYTAAYYNKQYPHYSTNKKGQVVISRPKQKATGMSQRLSSPTWILAGEGGRQEDVFINPVGHSGRNSPRGQGRGTTIVNVFVDGVLRKARTQIMSDEGIFK